MFLIEDRFEDSGVGCAARVDQSTDAFVGALNALNLLKNFGQSAIGLRNFVRQGGKSFRILSIDADQGSQAG